MDSEKALNNPPFEIEKIWRYSLLEEYGEDIIDLNVVVKVEDYYHTVRLPFTFLGEHCKEHFPETAEYYNAVRRSIKGLGPKHNRMFEIMDEEGFDHLPYIYSAIKLDYNLRQAIENEQSSGQCRSGIFDKDGNFTPVDKWLEKKEGLEMDKMIAEMRRTNIRNDAFMDDLMEHLNEEALNRFPEIFNAKPELIKEFHGKLIDWVRQIGEGMDKLSFRASGEQSEK